MTTGFLLDLVREKGETSPAFAHLCKRLRFRQSDCQRCQDICPENAITLTPGPVVNERCSGCGLCQTACPTEVFQGAVHTDQVLLNKIGPFLVEDRSLDGDKRRFFMHCQEAEPQHQKSFPIPCLGSITEHFMLGVAQQGDLVLTKGDCAQCHLRKGVLLLNNARAVFQSLVNSLNLNNFTLSLREKQREKQPPLSRRGFFSKVSGQQKNDNTPVELSPSIRDSQTEPTGVSEGSSEPRPSPKRAFLQTLLEKTEQPDSAFLPYDVNACWATLKIDENHCATCGICVNLCPTGAISRKIENGRLSHFFNASLCNNCRLCEEACPEKVISLKQDVRLGDALKGEAEVVTRISLNSCLICGETIPAKEGRICITCQKRQMNARVMSSTC